MSKRKRFLQSYAESSSSDDNGKEVDNEEWRPKIKIHLPAAKWSSSNFEKKDDEEECHPSNGEESSSDDNKKNQDEAWQTPRGNQPKFAPFIGRDGPKIPHIEDLGASEDLPAELFYDLLTPDEFFDEIAKQTNLYASEQSKEKNLGEWPETNKYELKRFFGLIMWMGLVRLPSIPLYWSFDSVFIQTFPVKVMSKTRFEALLEMTYFADSRKCNSADPMYKIQSLVQSLEEKFKKYYVPERNVRIDEKLIPFHDRFTLKQYLRRKRYKYGIRIFKLRCQSGYTYAIRVINAKCLKKKAFPSKIAQSLCNDLSDKGYTLFTDRWYTSVKLAKKLIANKIHLVGPLHPNRRGNPKMVVSQILREGEIFAQENEDGITVLKWKSKRDVLMLSTKHSTDMLWVNTGQSNANLIPEMVFDYKSEKLTDDLSERVNSYTDPVVKSVKWYRKVAFELIVNVALTNSYILYKAVTKKNDSLMDYRAKLVEYLTERRDEDDKAPRTVEIHLRV